MAMVLALATLAMPLPPYAYAAPYAAGYGVTNAARVVHVAKRSADAEPEADADAYYLGGYGLGYGYGGLYGGYGYRAYGAYPYAYGYYGKRSAEAEPEAEADAY